MTRGLRILLTITAILYGVYFVGTAIFLSTALFERVVSLGPRSGRLIMSSGWSFIPSIVHMRDVRLEIEDRNIELTVRLPEARAQINLWKLFRKKVHVTYIRGTSDLNRGATVSLMLKPPDEKAAYERESARLEREHPEPPSPWLIRIENVDLPALTMMQVESWRFKGVAKIRGGFQLRPGQDAEVFKSELEIVDGHIKGFAEAIHGWVGVQFDYFRKSEVDGLKIFRYLTSDFQLWGGFTQLRALNSFLISARPVRFDRAEGVFAAKGRIERGKILAPTQVVLGSDQMVLTIGPTELKGRGYLEWTLQDKSFGVLSLDMKNVSVTVSRSRARLFERGRLSGRAISPDLDLVDPFRRISLELRARFQHPLSIRQWSKFLPRDVKLKAGDILVDAHLSAFSGYRPHEYRSSPPILFERDYVNVRLLNAKAVIGDRTEIANGEIQATMDLRPLQLSEGTWSAKRAQVIGRGFDFRFRDRDGNDLGHDRGWWFRVGSRGASLSFDSNGTSPDWTWTVPIEVSLRDTDPVMSYLRAEDKISGFAQGAGSMRGLDLRAVIESRDERLRLSQISFEAGGEAGGGVGGDGGDGGDGGAGRRPTLVGEGEMHVYGNRTDGRFLLSSGLLSVGLKIRDSEMGYSLFAGRSWLQEETEQLLQYQAPRAQP